MMFKKHMKNYRDARQSFALFIILGNMVLILFVAFILIRVSHT